MHQDQWRVAEALFRHSVLGTILSRKLRRRELKRTIAELAAQEWTAPDDKPRRIAAKTIEAWYYLCRKGGVDALKPRPRKDRGTTKSIPGDLRELILAMKREDPGRSAPLIIEELVLAGRLKKKQASVSTVQRLLKREGLSGPALELDRPARFRWTASRCGELWQSDAVHGPALFDPSAGRPVRVKVFALLDDRSRLVPYARASFHETQQDFLLVLLGAIQRRGVPIGLLTDNHASFTGSDVALACAQLGVRLHFARPYDGPGKGKIERFWRTFRGRFLDRLDLAKVQTLDDLNVRIATWIAAYNQRPHAGVGGRTPLEAWEEDAEEVRWVDDPGVLEAAFTATAERAARNDSTCQVRGRTYEVPAHLRDRKVTIGWSLLAPDRLWVQDGETRLPIREVDPEGNSRRARVPGKKVAKMEGTKKTGLNAVEALLREAARPAKRKEDGRHDA